jgi:hypothetical protein
MGSYYACARSFGRRIQRFGKSKVYFLCFGGNQKGRNPLRLMAISMVWVRGFEWLPGEVMSPSEKAKADAMIYIMNCGHIVPPGQPYLDCIADGYRAFGFHQRYLSEAVRRAERSR